MGLRSYIRSLSESKWLLRQLIIELALVRDVIAGGGEFVKGVVDWHTVASRMNSALVDNLEVCPRLHPSPQTIPTACLSGTSTLPRISGCSGPAATSLPQRPGQCAVPLAFARPSGVDLAGVR